MAVRSSATVEDGDDHSYAGVFVSKLNVPKQVHAVVSAVRELYNAVTNPRTLSYQDFAGLVDEPIKLAVIVQTMVDARVSGVLFTDVAQDGTTGLLVEAVSGLGESLVSGSVRPQRYRVVAEQAHRVDREPAADLLTTQNIQGLASLAASVKKIFPRPQDVEWGIDRGGRVHILQSRDITAPLQLPSTLDVNGPGVVMGFGASPGVATGRPVFIDEAGVAEFPLGAVLIAECTDTDYLPAMRRAAAIVTQEGGLLSHAAIVSRELGLPCVVGAPTAETLVESEYVTVDGTRGIAYTGIVVRDDFGSRIELFDQSELFCFDTVLVVERFGVTALLEPSWGKTVVHIGDDPSTEFVEWITTQLPAGTPPEFRVGPKIAICDAWRQSIDTFPEFVHRFHELVAAAESLDATRLDAGMTATAQDAAEAARFARDTTRGALERYSSLLLSNRYYLLANTLLPEGYGARAVYQACFPYLVADETTFGELMRQPLGDGSHLPSGVAQAKRTYAVLAHWREHSYPHYAQLGATGDGYACVEEELQHQLGFPDGAGYDTIIHRIQGL